MPSRTPPPNNANNLKQTPIPVVPMTMKIVNSDGTVTRSGQLLLQQLQQAVSAGSGGGGGGTGSGGAAPDVTIHGPAEIFFRSNHQVEVDVEWRMGADASADNFLGAAVYLEDPDISSGANVPLDGSTQLNGTHQVSGQWAPVFVNDSTASPAVVMLDSTMGSVNGQTYKAPRNVRIYLAAYGPSSQPVLARATDPNPTPNIMVEIAQGPDQYQSGMEWAFLCTNPAVAVTTDYNRPDPNYYLTFTYDPPDPSIPLPPGVNRFGGCRIVFVQEDSKGVPQFPGSDTGISVPVAQSQAGYKSPVYSASGGQPGFRAYFCSEDNAQPLGSHINSLVEGVTPYAEVAVPEVSPAPDVTNFTISNESVQWLLSGVFIAHADFSWDLPATASGARYAGVVLYVVDVTGSVPPLTAFPFALTGQQSNVDTDFPLDWANIPANPEVWTIAAISVNTNGQLADDPAAFGQPGFRSPTVTWDIGPPTPGEAGSGEEYAPLVTIDAGAAATAAESTSSDGVRMVSFQVGTWTDPDSNQFGAAQVAMVIDSDPTKPTYWSVPGAAASFTTPLMPSFGNIGGASVPVDFYIVSDDPQGKKNHLVPGVTPKISITGGYTPTAGAIIPARSGWFDESQFNWDTTSSNVFQADRITADKIFVGSILRVGGGAGTDAASFAGQQNGQIAVYNSSNVLRGWIGEQQSTQGDGSAIYGAWFGQLWVGGVNPLTAPLFIDNQGIIEVGGIAAAHGATYPYISVRDNTGLEAGRIGAMISSATDPTGNVGSSPPTITSGAWFTQLAVGGSNLSNWNVLITPDLSNPLGSNFQMRNINLLSIDYPAHSGSPSNNEYKIEFGNSVWMTAGLTGWQFAGMRIYEIDGHQNVTAGQASGTSLLSRGLVIRGSFTQGYPILVSLTQWNGDQSGSDLPAQFFGTLAMSSPLSPYIQNVVIASGSATGPQGGLAIDGHAYMRLADQSGNTLFSADINGCKALSFSVGAKQVIDSSGNWVGNAIAASQTPWLSDIAGANHNLTNVASIQVNGATTTGSLAIGSTGDGISATGVVTGSQYFVGGTQVINTSGQYVQAVNTTQGITCGSLSTTNGQLSCGDLIVGPGPAGSGSKRLIMYEIDGSTLVTCAQNGIWSGLGVQTNSDIYSGRFGIEAGGAAGASSNFLGLTANSGDQFTLTTSIGNLTVRIIGGLICAG